ncbi:Protein CBG11761 [Caenorhabditis briggsae]|uniref:Protein CBG11761 n=1 Tax=Caenorhabditis briggsae TaxID=6238 RepID=A8XE15_CAEBR|nr:Protein CBG11761 [Caenorhabditis briggsae]CAP30821.2 Protein CBG11761 [Caenorhabditis briggsae]
MTNVEAKIPLTAVSKIDGRTRECREALHDTTKYCYHSYDIIRPNHGRLGAPKRVRLYGTPSLTYQHVQGVQVVIRARFHSI